MKTFLNMRLTTSLNFSFTLAFLFVSTLIFAQPANDNCSGAIALDCGDSVVASTIGATADDVPECTPTFSGPSVWYTVTGTGGDITVTTCSELTDYNTQLAVYAGSCSDLACIGGNNVDYSCEAGARNSTFTFTSVAGATYYIYVTGQGGADGTFELTVECEDVPVTNDICDGAESIACGDVVVGTTDGASSESVPFCGTNLSSAPGVWYAFDGDGSTVTVTTCGAATNYDTKLGVFSGSCGSLSCVGGDDDDFGCNFSTLQSVVTFTAEAGTTYYFYVTGFGSNSGTFELSVDCVSGPDNNECADATSISCGDVVSGSTESASTASVSFCGTTLTTAGAVWYEFLGTGQEVTITTCNAGTDFDTKLGVFSGSCGSLSCVAGDDDDSCPFSNLRSRVTFQSEPGEIYYFIVTGFGTNTGNYELSVECGELPINNTSCEGAIAVDCDDVVEGSTIGAPNNPELGDCSGVDLGSAEGVWYQIEGNGLLVSAETIQDGTDYDPAIGVFEGSCDALNCVTANNNAVVTTRMARVEFLAEEGSTYYIYVTGNLGAEGNFRMAITCSVPNDDCSNAIAIDCNTTVTGSTSDATSDSYPSCGTSFSSAEGVWYTFTGSGTETTVSTCNAGTNFDTKLFLFSGSCESLDCIDGNDDASCSFSSTRSTITFDSEEGTTYYVLVTGFGSSDGDFELSLDCEEDDDNGDECSDLFELLCGDNITGSTVGEPSNTVPFCGTSLSTAGGVFFRFTGIGETVTVSTCNPGTNYDTKLGVFSNSCNDLVCVGGNDDQGGAFDPACNVTGNGFNRGSTVSFFAADGEEYYIYVTGFLANTGDFELSVDCTANLTIDPNMLGNTADSKNYDQIQVGNPYPNPTNAANVTMDIDLPIEGTTNIRIIDQLGRLVQMVEVDMFAGNNQLNLDVADLANGTYYINVTIDGQQFIKKLAVLR